MYFVRRAFLKTREASLILSLRIFKQEVEARASRTHIPHLYRGDL